MNIIEQFIEGKLGDPAQCEDALVITESFAAVIDGCTSKNEVLWGGRTPGRIAAECVAAELKGIPHEATMQQTLLRLTAAMNQSYEELGALEEVVQNPALRAGACTAIFSVHHQQLWMIGDCQALIDDKLIRFPTPIEDAMTELRAYLVDTELARGNTIENLRKNDKTRELLLPLLKRQHYVVNNESAIHGYSLVNGFPIPETLVSCIPIPAGTRSLVLASDGYPKPMPTLKESENYLKNVLSEDPLLYRVFKSTKGFTEGNMSYDDRCYLRICL